MYSNCDVVELFLNGESLGTKKRDVKSYPACGLYWNVIFNNGQNELVAFGRTTDDEVRDEIEMNYQTEKWDEPSKLVLKEIPIDDEYSWLEVKALDKNGILCLDATNFVEFSAIGEAELIKHQGTVHGSQKVGLCNGVAKIKLKKVGAAISAFVQSEGIKSARLEL